MHIHVSYLPSMVMLALLVLIAHSVCAQQDDDSLLSTEFLNACTEGQVDVLEALLQEHPNWVNGRSDSGETCLHVAGIKGQAQVSQLLLARGADVDIRSEYEGGLRMHPLSWNVYGGHLENVKALVNEGKANVNLDFDDGQGNVVTVLDTITSILSYDDEEEKNPELETYRQVRAFLLEHGAKRYQDLQAEDL